MGNNNKGVNSPAPTTAEVVGGVYNTVPPTLQDGQAAALQSDVNGNLKVDVVAGGGSPDINIAKIGGNPEAINNPLPVELSDGTNPFGISGNPLRITGNKTDNTAPGGSNWIGALVATASYKSPKLIEGNQVDLHENLQGALRVRLDQTDTVGCVPVAVRYNQLELNFSTAFDTTQITNTFSGGGSVSQGSGQATFACGTAGTGQATGISVAALNYRPGHEWYSLFSAAFTTPTDATNINYQHIGPYSATDGFYIGWDKTTFNFTQLQNSVVTAIPRASWNGDPVDGSVGSTFTSGGVPVVLNFAKINVFRIRGTWFGASVVILEVLCPDDIWVRLHTLRFPNTLTTPYTYTTTFNMQVDVKKVSSDGTNLQINTPCWALGTHDPTARVVDAINDNTLVGVQRAVISGKSPSGSYNNVGITADAALTVGGSGDTHANAATWTSITTSQIAHVNGANNNIGAGGTTVTTTYSPTAGANRAVVVTFNANGAFTGLTVKDNLNNVLTAGPTINNAAAFVQFPVPSGVTGYTATWTTSRQASLCVEEYSGVGSVDTSPSGGTASGTSTTASITVVPDEGSDWVVAGLADVANTLTATVGNSREQITANGSRQTLIDTTGTTCTATLTSSAWTGVAVVLRPSMSGGTALNTSLAIVNNSFAYNSVAVQLVGSGTLSGGTVTGEVSVDNSNWIGITAVNSATGLQTSVAVSLLALANTGLVYNITGYNYFRIRLSSQITGLSGAVVLSYNVQGLASPNVSSTINTGTINVSSNQGTPNTIANAWPMEITDSTNGPAAVKAASTAAVAADPALVVAVSPNNSVAVTNTGTFAVQSAATLAAETTKVIGTVRVLGNAGAIVDAATGASVPANAVQSGNRGSTALPTAVADGQLVSPMTDKYGRQAVVLNTVRDLVGVLILSNNSGSTAQNFGSAGGTGVYLDITTFVVTNRSTTATVVSLADGTNTYTFAIAANGGMVINFPTPLPAASTATQWTVLNSAGVACDYMAVVVKNK